MPRGPRLDAPGVLHNVMVRSIEHRQLFLSRTDSEDFVRRLAGSLRAAGATLYAWSV